MDGSNGPTAIAKVNRNRSGWPDPRKPDAPLDAAIAEILPTMFAENGFWSGSNDNPDHQVLSPDHWTMQAPQELGVTKYGPSGVAEGVIKANSLDIEVLWESGRGPMAVRYTNVMIVESDSPVIARPGDSGGLVTDRDHHPLGMVLCGQEGKYKPSEAGKPYAVVQPLHPILEAAGMVIFTGRQST